MRPKPLIAAAALFPLAFGLVSGQPVQAEPTLERPYTDHAVIQRNKPVSLAGLAAGGSAVDITFAGRSLQTQADKDGRWQAMMEPVPAGGPYTLSVEDSDGRLELTDVMVGDVLLCSGQSNMEYPVYRALNPDAAVSGSEDDKLRLLTVPRSTALTPQAHLPDGAGWAVSGPDVVRDFSAVCYFTGRQLRADSDVPVGLIDASWGGSQIEAWLPAKAMEPLGIHGAQLGLLESYRKDPEAAMASFGETWESWWREAHGSTPWASTSEDADWNPVPETFPDWKVYDDPETENHYGRLWYSREVELTEAQADGAASISLGLFDDTDATWVNGHFIGSTSSWSDHRTYNVPQGILKPGSNTIMINVLNTYGQGGMMGPGEAIALKFGNGNTLPLGDDWQYRVVHQPDSGGPRPPWETVTGYTAIQNAMIAPLAGISLKAAIWYQGESNVGRADEYQPLLQALMDTWRDYFGKDLPVVIVQLPVYGAMPDTPVDSGWSGIREAQRKVALSDPQTGLAVTLDAGDRTDIHPANKLLVAERVSRILSILMEQTSGHEDGASPQSVAFDGNTIKITLPEGRYKVIGSNAPNAFEVCDTSGVCAWADARIEGRQVLVNLQKAADPREIRYCWGDAPVCNLFTSADVPVTPFQVEVPAR
ncbi:sialate O-acetylesterase [Henriciella sp.]|uniref:sialate O-acetylesterase n=1 Tax=Henriciella sp. TaxID=1968823 RepID=UPI00262BC9BE|nr:sialate O-acetylesterase [Henriciella sp.]